MTLKFTDRNPSIATLIAVRQLLSEYRNSPPKDLRDEIRATGQICLGEMPGIAARRIAEAATKLKLNVVIEDLSHTSYLPYDRGTGCAWVIENDADAAAITAEMLAMGIPVSEVEID